jgi:hypothetical protein
MYPTLEVNTTLFFYAVNYSTKKFFASTGGAATGGTGTGKKNPARWPGRVVCLFVC